MNHALKLWFRSACMWFTSAACSPACRNGGTCHGSSYSAYCTCPSGYQGSYCQNRGAHNQEHACSHRTMAHLFTVHIYVSSFTYICSYQLYSSLSEWRNMPSFHLLFLLPLSQWVLRILLSEQRYAQTTMHVASDP